jgi:hypothetical protein
MALPSLFPGYNKLLDSFALVFGCPDFLALCHFPVGSKADISLTP